MDLPTTTKNIEPLQKKNLTIKKLDLPIKFFFFFMAIVWLFASVGRVSVSSMQDYFRLHKLKNKSLTKWRLAPSLHPQSETVLFSIFLYITLRMIQIALGYSFQSDPLNIYFHQLGPLARVGLVVAKSVFVLFVCLSPFPFVFF